MTDQQILESLKGEQAEKAFKELVSRYGEKLYVKIRSMVSSHEDADDVLQEVLIKVYQNVHRFHQNSSLFTWMYRIACNEALSFLRKRQRRNSTISGSELMVESGQDSMNGVEPSGDQIQQTLQAALVSLPEKQRKVFELRYYQEMPYQEMSRILGTSVGALKASFHHASKKIENYCKQALL